MNEWNGCRIREDVADVLVRCLGTKEATGKTFEVQTLPGLDKVWISDVLRLTPGWAMIRYV